MSYYRRMRLQLPGETRFRFFEILLAVVAVVGLCALGCAAPQAQKRHDEGAAFVVRTLHASGLRFGIDGSTRALWGYMRSNHRLISASSARPGDVVFFDTRGTGEQPRCADHAAVVERVSPDGRIGFVELRGGRLRHSVADPRRPGERRDTRGDVLNSFLRPVHPDDPPGARYFAGQMLCGIARGR